MIIWCRRGSLDTLIGQPLSEVQVPKLGRPVTVKTIYRKSSIFQLDDEFLNHLSYMSSTSCHDWNTKPDQEWWIFCISTTFFIFNFDDLDKVVVTSTSSMGSAIMKSTMTWFKLACVCAFLSPRIRINLCLGIIYTFTKNYVIKFTLWLHKT